MPLEDLPLGAGVHWEVGGGSWSQALCNAAAPIRIYPRAQQARLAGPELMSYGTNSGRVYFSDLTLAFLEDTNQYIANYSKNRTTEEEGEGARLL